MVFIDRLSGVHIPSINDLGLAEGPPDAVSGDLAHPQRSNIAEQVLLYSNLAHFPIHRNKVEEVCT